MTAKDKGGLFIAYDDVWLLDGVRTPFVDYNGALGLGVADRSWHQGCAGGF